MIVSPPRRLRVLLNPGSGSKGGLSTNDIGDAEVRAAMTRAGLDDELHLTDSEDDAVRLTREAADAGYD
ncbi:MAG: hypothetical protein H0V24_07635, partial [Chloroflexia bacterium]|nr:hypothetical protein [Chloroflexia bacterium]